MKNKESVSIETVIKTFFPRKKLFSVKETALLVDVLLYGNKRTDTSLEIIDSFTKTFLSDRKKFSVEEAHLLVSTIVDSGRSVNFVAAKQFENLFFPKKFDFNLQEASTLAGVLLSGGPSKSQQMKLSRLYGHSNYFTCALNQIVDVFNAVDDSASICHGKTDGNGRLVHVIDVDLGKERRTTSTGRDARKTFKKYNG